MNFLVDNSGSEKHIKVKVFTESMVCINLVLNSIFSFYLSIVISYAEM